MIELRALSKKSPLNEIVDDVADDLKVIDFKREFGQEIKLPCVTRE